MPHPISCSGVARSAVAAVALATQAAAWPSDPAVNVSLSPVARQQVRPVAVPDGAGGAIVLWVDHRNTVSGSTEIFAARVTAHGETPWGPLGVPVHLTSRVSRDYGLSAIPDGSGGAIITWEYAAVGQDAQVRAQRIDGTGQILWDPAGVIVTSHLTNYCRAPCVPGPLVSDGSDGVYVVWEELRPSQAIDIRAQRIGPTGALQWGPTGRLVCGVNGNQKAPRIASDLERGAIITWTDFRSGSTGAIYAQRIDSEGNPYWTLDGIPLTPPSDDDYPELVSDGNSGAIITWTDTGSNPNAWALRIDRDGVPVWPSPVWYSGYLHGCHMIEDGSGGTLVLLEDGHALHRVGAGGEVPWGVKGIPISPSPFEDVEAEEMIADGNGGAIVTWSRLVGTRWDTYAQRIDAAGNKLWDGAGIVISNANADKYEPAIAPSSLGGAIITWEDARNGASNLDIYCQQVSADGQLGQTLSDAPHVASTLLLSVANPVRGSATARFSLRTRSALTLRLTDVAGREWLRTGLGELDAGTHLHRFDVSAYPSGVYLLQVQTPASASATCKVIVAH